MNLLEFADRFPEEVEYLENENLLYGMEIGGIREVQYKEERDLYDKIAFVGFPTLDGSGALISPDLQYAISSTCSNEAGAWEFLEYYLSDEYQMAVDISGFPLTKKALDEMVIESQMEDEVFVEAENGKYYSDQYHNCSPLTEERAEEIYDYVLSVENAYSYDVEILAIILEEAESFFAHQKTAKEVSDIIQSRVQIFMQEYM